MSHKMLRPFIVKVSVLGYFPLYFVYNVSTFCITELLSKFNVMLPLY